MERFFAVRDRNWSLVSETDWTSVSQFTLLASTKKGSKPDFHGALGGEQAKELYQFFVSKVQKGYEAERVKDGVFQAMMVKVLSLWLEVAALTSDLGGCSCE
jgi:D-tyrosyl-tRNA(Tyr) deacylase